MRPHLAIPLLGLLLASCASPGDGAKHGEAPAAAKTVAMPEALRTYLAEKYFVGVDPHDPAIDAAVEPLLTPSPILSAVGALEWERGQLEKFGEGKRFFAIVRVPGGKPHSIHFRGELPRSDREMDESRARILKRLYLGKGFVAAPDPELNHWLGKEVDPDEAFKAAIALAAPALDAATTERALKNLKAPGTRSGELAIALRALAESAPAPELCRAALWVISRMDGMTFQRMKADESGMDPETSICDLKAVDARGFYENVYYAVKAKNQFPWGRELNDHDFLQFVLSPRGTGEPLQRWRRLFYEAIAPEIGWFLRTDLEKAIKLATDACYDFYQYEGDTTWEDFGTLTGLAVHEGRCEDCSNMENALLRSIAIPGCQAFTPFWATGDGNHAWTWIPAFGVACGEGKSAAKVFVKTWDSLEDVTEKYVPVTTLQFAAPVQGEAQLMVWNMDEWRRVAKVGVRDGFAVFKDVGCPRDFVLAVRMPEDKSRVFVFALAPGGVMTPLKQGEPGPGTLETVVEERPPANPELGNAMRGVEVWTEDGWKDLESERASDYVLRFKAEELRLYRLKREKASGRPFVVARGENGKGVVGAR